MRISDWSSDVCSSDLSIKPEISVLVGLCTHLGCAPELVAEIRPQPFDPEWKGGYFCPCHKSRFDMAGRVFQGVPAPINLLVPPHHYENDTTIVIGVDPQGAAYAMSNVISRPAKNVWDWVNERAPGMTPVSRKTQSDSSPPNTINFWTTLQQDRLGK